VADWLLSLPGTPPLELVAQHYERGGQPALALDYWHRAAEAAASSYANAQALKHVERALALAPEDDLERRIALCVLRCRVLERLADRAQRASALDELHRMVNSNPNSRHAIEYFILRSRFFSDGGEESAALAEISQIVSTPSLNESDLAADAHARIAQCLFRLGRINEAQNLSIKALEVARLTGNKHIEGVVLNDLGTQADDFGDYDSAINHYSQALALHKRVGNRNNEGGTLSNLGYAAMMLGEYETACDQFQNAIRIFKQIGHRLHEGITLINLALARLNMGNPDEAHECAASAYRMLTAMNARAAAAAAQRVVGQSMLARNEYRDARKNFEAAQGLFLELKLPHLAQECLALKASEALARSDPEHALSEIAPVIQDVLEGGSLDGAEEPMRTLLICYQVMAATNDRRAQEFIDRARLKLIERAERINGISRRNNYLHKVPYHHQIIFAWENEIQ
jgi:tetratricopeptide (TPR) repeat protein